MAVSQFLKKHSSQKRLTQRRGRRKKQKVGTSTPEAVFAEKTLPSKPSHLKITPELFFSLIPYMDNTTYNPDLHELPH